MAGKLDGLGEGTSKHSSARPHGGYGTAITELAGKDSKAQGKGGFDPAHSNTSQQMGRLGQADSQLLQLSRQMARIFLEFPVRWPAGPRRHTDTQVAAQVSRWGGWSTGCSTQRSGREGREDPRREERPAAALTLLSTAGYHLCIPLM